MNILFVIIATLFSVCVYAGTKIETATTHLTFQADVAKGYKLINKYNELSLLVENKQFDQAETSAESLIKSYEALFDTSIKQYAFQSQSEYDEFKNSTSEDFEWIHFSYIECLKLQAFTKSERHNFIEALIILNQAQKLAPFSASLLIETGYNLAQLDRSDEALVNYTKAHDLSIKYPSQKLFQAPALRGMGATLVGLNRLNEAEQAINESLRLDPSSNLARNELEYINKARNLN